MTSHPNKPVEMPDELDKIFNPVVLDDLGIPEWWIKQTKAALSACIKAREKDADRRGVTKGRRIQAESTLGRYEDHVDMNKFLYEQVEAWRYEEGQYSQPKKEDI